MSDCVATVGTFDGFHLGHRDLISKLLSLADERGLASQIITFANHPLEIIAPDRSPKLVCRRDDTLAYLDKSGVDRVSVLDFTHELAQLTAREFFKLLRAQYCVKVLIMGFNNTIGSDRLATHDAYIKAGADEDVEVIFVDPFVEVQTGLTPSSSLLRRLVRDGDVATFRILANNAYTIGGVVVKGKQNGRKIGFPTFNVDYDKSLELPAPGVYAGLVSIKGNMDQAVISVGNNPTISSDNPLTIEAHAIGRNYDDCYGDKIEVAFVRKLRDQHRFGSIEELKQAIAADIRAVNR